MSTRIDIQNEKLTYTCNCGWIDLTHLTSGERRYASPGYLWQDVLQERGLQLGNRSDRHVIKYKQHMGKYGFSSEFSKIYWIKKGLSLNAKRSVALSIFMEVSMGFENLQSSLSAVTDSGFSEEDLVSDLIGFYVVMFGGIDWKSLCRPVSKQAAFKVWDTFGPVGKVKNKTFSPHFHDCEECKSKHGVLVPQFPPLFNSVHPAQKGVDFDEARGDGVVPEHMLSTLFE